MGHKGHHQPLVWCSGSKGSKGCMGPMGVSGGEYPVGL